MTKLNVTMFDFDAIATNNPQFKHWSPFCIILPFTSMGRRQFVEDDTMILVWQLPLAKECRDEDTGVNVKCAMPPMVRKVYDL